MISVGANVTAQAGPPRTSTLITANANVTAGKAGVTTNRGKLAIATSAGPFAGVILQNGLTNATATLQVSGPLDRSIANVGSGTAEEVGIDSTGKLVRASDATCVSLPYLVGFCDTDGTVLVSPHKEGGGTTAVANATIAKGSVLRTTNSGKVAAATTSLRTIPFHALALTDITSGATGNIHVNGPVDRAVINLGAGVACAVGVNSSGVPVRATDATCISHPNYLGTCDTDGTITFSPWRGNTYNVLDFGAFADATTDDLPAFTAMIAAATASGVKATGFVPRGRYYLSAKLPLFPIGFSLVGEGYVSADNGGSQLEFHSATDSGLFPWFQLDAESGTGIRIRGLCLVNKNTANKGGTCTNTIGFQAHIKTVTNATPIVIETDIDHGLTNGQTAVIDGVRGCTNANGSHVVTVVSRRIISLDGTTGNGEYTKGGAAIEIVGGGDIGIDECQFMGWQYNVIYDGTEQPFLVRCNHTGNGSGINRCSYGVWTTSGNQRGNGWNPTYTVSTNFIIVEKNFFNDPSTAWFSDGGVNHIYKENADNMAGGYVINWRNVQAACYEDSYCEGNTTLTPLTPGAICLDGCVNITFKRNVVSVGGNIIGVPFIQFVGDATHGVTFEGDTVACGNASGILQGAALCTEVSILSGLWTNNHASGVLSDAEFGGPSYISPSWHLGGGNPGRMGSNKAVPAASFHLRHLEGAGTSAHRLEHSYGAIMSDWVATGAFGENQQHLRQLRTQGGSGNPGTGTTSGLGFLPLAGSAGATAFGDTWAVPDNSVVLADVYVIGYDNADETKYAVFRKQLVITSNGTTCTIRSTDDFGTPKNTDTFTAPAFDFVSKALRIKATGQSYATSWIARVEYTIIKH